MAKIAHNISYSYLPHADFSFSLNYFSFLNNLFLFL